MKLTMPDEQELQRITVATSVIGDKTALLILYLLERHNELTFTELKQNVPASPTTLSRKLVILQHAHLVVADRTHHPVKVYYSIDQTYHHRQIRRYVAAFERLALDMEL